uniref:Cytochrome c-553 n=1 Tax=Pleurostichidium falkenbergii TaxID=121064 RepID=A0A4D6UX58_9FLOR|nr:cytochrome c553 [Pleurostichidium falkenbergii]QCH39575.1 cytochrome c553 [Pleurostichidium falkenbergii]
MKFLLSIFLNFFALSSLVSCLVFAQEIDLDAGEQVFSNNCTACHAGGNNSVNPAKTLNLDDLKQYSKDSVDAITYQINNGAGAMPPFAGTLSEEQISSVANFVLSQATNNSW